MTAVNIEFVIEYYTKLEKRKKKSQAYQIAKKRSTWLKQANITMRFFELKVIVF
jgi:hypothetical protein